MRIILFKAKRIDNRKWVEGYYVKTSEASYIVVPYSQSDISGAEGSTIEVDEKTICQFTGKNDCNGNRIWENDIVKEACNGRIKRVVWDDESATYKLENLGEGYTIRDSHIEWEVIGNIFDNPELLND